MDRVLRTNLVRTRVAVMLKATFLSLFICLLFLSSSAQQWTILGNESQVSSAASAFTSITVLDGNPYVFFREGSNIGRVKKRNTTTGAWEQVGNDIGTNITYTRIYTDRANTLFITYVDAANGNRLAVRTFNATTNLWEAMNDDINNLYVSTGSVTNSVSQYSSTPRSALAFDYNNMPFIAFGEGTNLTPYVKKFDGTSWVNVGTGAVDATVKAVAVSLVIDEVDAVWLTFSSLATPTSTTGSMALYKFSNGTWAPVTIPNPVPGGSSTTAPTTGVRHTNLALNAEGNLAIAYFNTGNTNRATVVVYNKTTNAWSFSATLSGRDAPNLSLISDASGNLYCAFNDFFASTNRFIARVFKQYAGSNAWRELKDPSLTGIDEPIGNIMIAVGSDTSKPFIVYTKPNASSVTTPIVRLFVPAGNPVVLTTKTMTNIATTTAIAGGDIASDGGSAVTERGVAYGTAPNPTIANNKMVDASGGTGSFNVTLSGLTPASFYYARAYAINSGGTSYGENVRLSTAAAPDAVVTSAKQMESLNRGVVAVRTSSTSVYIGWRMLGTDPANIAFNIYRDGVKLNTTPITASTNYIDNISTDGAYVVKPVINDVEGTASQPVTVWLNNQLTIPLQIPAGGTTPDGQAYTYSANDASVGDMDGDGEYEVVLRWEPSVKNDNAGGYSGNQIFDCYKFNGTRLWRIDLGKNMPAGPHYNQFMVYDFDGDGKSEMILKTADGTIDGAGVTIGDPLVDYRNAGGWVHNGPEFLTVFNGMTGAAMSTVAFQPARGNINDWGDNYGNRADRFVFAVAYLDGIRPSLVAGRGYYNKLVRAAYDWRNGQLTLRWIFNSETAGNEAYRGQGNHQMTIGDIDGDGKDEIINGSSAINDDGNRLWTWRFGHGDALHMTDMDPDRPGQEIWQCLESPTDYAPHGLRFNDAKTGETIFGIPTTGDVGRAMAADIDPTHRGYEVWGSSGNLYNSKGVQISTNKPTYNFGIWWDGDLARELLDGTKVDKWNHTNNTLGRLFTVYLAAPISSNNSTKANPCLQADLLGDWREEMLFRYADNSALVLFTTTIPTDQRIFTLMHDAQYRTGIAWQNSAYNQPPYPSFYLGYDMVTPPQPNIFLAAAPSALPVKLIASKAYQKGNGVQVEWTAEGEADADRYEVEKSADGRTFTKVANMKAKVSSGRNAYDWLDVQPYSGNNFYRIKAMDITGQVQYSRTMRVNLSGTQQAFAVYPSPLAGTECTVQLTNVAKGKYILSLINNAGQEVLQKTMEHGGGSSSLPLVLPANMASGIYQLSITGSDWRMSQPLIKK